MSRRALLVTGTAALIAVLFLVVRLNRSEDDTPASARIAEPGVRRDESETADQLPEPHGQDGTERVDTTSPAPPAATSTPDPDPETEWPDPSTQPEKWLMHQRAKAIRSRVDAFRALAGPEKALDVVMASVVARMDLDGTSQLHPQGEAITRKAFDDDHMCIDSSLGNGQRRTYFFSREQYPLAFELRDWRRAGDPGTIDVVSDDMKLQVLALAEETISLLEMAEATTHH